MSASSPVQPADKAPTGLFDGEWMEPVRRLPGDAILTVSVESWEGPLDLLLALARTQKVDLREISILALVEQYLRFIEEAAELRLELAADYLVMAAWLAYLKSGLLLPKEAQPEPSPEELALRLHLRLQRLEAMREAGARLMARDRLGRDVFPRAAPEGLHRPRAIVWQASLFDIIQAYGQVKARTAPRIHIVHRRPVMTLDEAIERVSRLIGMELDWAELGRFLPETADPQLRRSALASSFVAALELARLGRVELRQEETFAPLYLRAPAVPS
ncbi:segregation and condensation protein A [Sphingobium sp. B1D7B]|nr:segregation and condensation protein A [Sphingobium sp. B11D3B]MCW2393121.1 segregation and condensation protein A [Sphingobium sp. B11D3A]MCW2395445.1 segregation and condensation protein A [Sphingobium sp. B8D3B]MCW2404926.1 segregation and condensation protein A [Sphingobium sp. B1D7B]MCW2413036.1 segregation and condensation protein A [Sphingobium sp. B8D3D]MCW2414665.1 segregation and condensation protein A [Sphingobium sp. B8D3A]MCW2418960.1 segregation and condensation protein A [Sp